MTLSIISSGIDTSLSTKLNTNFDVLNYKKPNTLIPSGSATGSTYTDIYSASIASSVYCTAFILHAGISVQHASNPGNLYYRVNVTLSDATTSTAVSEQTIAGVTAVNYTVRNHSYVCPVGKYITNITIQGYRASSNTGTIAFLSGDTLQSASNAYLAALGSHIIYFTES